MDTHAIHWGSACAHSTAVTKVVHLASGAKVLFELYQKFQDKWLVVSTTERYAWCWTFLSPLYTREKCMPFFRLFLYRAFVLDLDQVLCHCIKSTYIQYVFRSKFVQLTFRSFKLRNIAVSQASVRSLVIIVITSDQQCFQLLQGNTFLLNIWSMYVYILRSAIKRTCMHDGPTLQNHDSYNSVQVQRHWPRPLTTPPVVSI